MVSFVRNLFGGSNTADKALDMAGAAIKGVGTWIDEKNLTDEERVKFTIEAGRAHLELIKATADENSIRSVTRRWLAWGIAGTVCASFVTGVVLAIGGNKDAVQAIVALSEAYSLGWAFVSVIVFYFGVQFFRTK